MRRPRGIRVTRNFDRNLESIRRFVNDRETPQLFDAVVAHLLDTVIPNLERFPGLGVNCRERRPLSLEETARMEALKKRLGPGTELREYVTGDYVILYAVRSAAVYLLAVKHHRQLSFDLSQRS
jgi:plasmid stabilization system protein ParE